MRILIVGFGNLARELLAKIKTFPEYGEHKQIAASHVHVNRNSLSYGPNYVVEIPDPHGDGYRTYKDGFQAINDYSTTVSDYDEHILGEIAAGHYSLVIDCTNKTKSSIEFIDKVSAVMPSNCRLIKANNLASSDDTISKIREIFDGGLPWTPSKFNLDLLETAEAEWNFAQKRMQELHLEKRTRTVEERPEMIGRTNREYVFLDNLIPDVDLKSIDRFITNNEPYSITYERSEFYSDVNKCQIVKHEMLDWFFGAHCVEGAATQAHATPSLKLASSKYVCYNFDKAVAIPEEDYDYAVEYVIDGHLEIKDSTEDRWLPVPSKTAYAYKPKINLPIRKISNGLRSMIFYFEEQRLLHCMFQLIWIIHQRGHYDDG